MASETGLKHPVALELNVKSNAPLCANKNEVPMPNTATIVKIDFFIRTEKYTKVFYPFLPLGKKY